MTATAWTSARRRGCFPAPRGSACPPLRRHGRAPLPPSPKRKINSRAPFSPILSQPGMLSIESPIRAIKSGDLFRRHAHDFFPLSRHPRIRSVLFGPAPGRSTRTFPPTSCIMSLSAGHQENFESRLGSLVSPARPSRSSASKPSNSRIGSCMASHIRRT